MNQFITSKFSKLSLVIIILGLFVHVLTAVYSIGHHHPDEHFQILEFANYKLGINEGSELPWEFAAQIRPTIQPTLATIYLSVCKSIGITNPFTQTFILRLFSAVIMVLLSVLLVYHYFPKHSQAIALIFSLCFAYIPFINVRFSSENYGLMFFLIAVILALKNQTKITPKILLFIGIALGMSFYFRFQMVAAMAGFGLWLLLVAKWNVKQIFTLVSGFCIAIFLNVLVDRWFYGNWVFSPYGYFYSNIIEKVAASFGTQPWHHYIEMFFLKTRPFSILLFALFAIGVYHKPKSVLLWSLIPFLLLHFLTAHKELRFLFPALLFFAIICCHGIEFLIQKFALQKWKWCIVGILFLINIPFLLPSMFLAANSQLQAWKFIQSNLNSENQIVYSADSTSSSKWHFSFKFYNSHIKNNLPVIDSSTYQYQKDLQNNEVFVLSNRKTLELAGVKLNQIYSTYPHFLNFFNTNEWNHGKNQQLIFKMELQNHNDTHQFK